VNNPWKVRQAAQSLQLQAFNPNADGTTNRLSHLSNVVPETSKVHSSRWLSSSWLYGIACEARTLGRKILRNMGFTTESNCYELQKSALVAALTSSMSSLLDIRLPNEEKHRCERPLQLLYRSRRELFAKQYMTLRFSNCGCIQSLELC